MGVAVTLLVLGAVVPWRARGGSVPWRARGASVLRDARGGSVGRGASGAGRAAAPWPGAPRWRRGPGTPPLDAAFLLDLCAAAVRGGSAVAGALVVTGRHLGGPEGDALVRAGTALGLGAPWDAAWAGAPPAVAALGEALRTGTEAGASPAAQLRAAAQRLRRERRTRARVAAGALGVRLTLPLGVCFLPAFALLGLAPVVLGLAGDLLGGVP